MLLPVEMITQILARLPVRSILQLRSVSKTWRDIIDNHVSVVLLLDRDIAFGKKLPTSFFIRPDHYVHDMEMYLVEKEEDGLMFKATKINFPQVIKLDNVVFVQAACGLFTVCYFAPSGVEGQELYYDFICNPFTGQFLQLPVIHTHDFMKGEVTGGFGYDPSTGEFKVVRIYFSSDTKETEILVFTLGSKSWKKVENYPQEERIKFETNTVSVDSMLHWFSKDPGLLLTFDIVSENFGYMQLPVPRLSPYPSFLYNLNGCLSMVDGYMYEDYTEIWVMKDYDVAESWTKFVILRGKFDSEYFLLNFQPILLLNESEILILLQGSTLLVYNVETGISTPLHVCGMPGNIHFRAYPYCGNLLSFQPAD